MKKHNPTLVNLWLKLNKHIKFVKLIIKEKLQNVK